MTGPETISRIRRCSGLQALNRAQKRYVQNALRMLFLAGGRIYDGGCHNNSPLLVLMDEARGEGKITFATGTADGFEHSWNQIEGTDFEITYPLGQGSERELRSWIPLIDYSARLTLTADELVPALSDTVDGLLCEFGALDHLQCGDKSACTHNLDMSSAIALRKALPALKKSPLMDFLEGPR
jgi:hypothetical protein